MKKLFSTLALALIAVASMAQQPVITFEKTDHDFGKINEGDGRVTTVFQFKNEGMEPLVLSNVRASCGCTTPKWTREPIEPGQTGEITVTYNPNGRPGRFQKTITVTSNATEATKKLYIRGEVIPKPAKPVNNYSVKMGDLSLKGQSINFGTISKGKMATKEIEYANLTSNDIKVELATRDEDNYLVSQVSLATVKPNETGKLIFAIDSKVCKTYGPVTVYAYVVVNGKQVTTDEYKITLKADIAEDFSQMTTEERQKAPIAEVDGTLDLGKVAAGKKVRKNISIHNSGVNALQVRRIYNTDSNLTVSNPKQVKSGKVGNARVDLNTTGLKAGSYSRQIQVITNDPNQPRRTVNVTWEVE